jgi:hypothetical protein
MALSPSRKQILIRESRDLVFRVSSGAGGFLGLVYALHHWDTRPLDCSGKAAEFSRCVDHSLASGVLTFLLPVFGGVIAGAIVGALLASRIRSRQPRSTTAMRQRRSSLVVHDDQGGMGGRWLLARYQGRCDSCQTKVTPGDRIRHSPGRNLCERCGAQDVA